MFIPHTNVPVELQINNQHHHLIYILTKKNLYIPLQLQVVLVWLVILQPSLMMLILNYSYINFQ